MDENSIIALIVYGGPALLASLMTLILLAYRAGWLWAFAIGSAAALAPAMLISLMIWFVMGFMREIDVTWSDRLFMFLMPLFIAAPGIIVSGLIAAISRLLSRRSKTSER